MMRYQIGLDTGGTFTDCVVVDQTGPVIESEAFTTLEDLSIGIVNALEEAAKQIGVSLEQTLADTRLSGLTEKERRPRGFGRDRRVGEERLKPGMKN